MAEVTQEEFLGRVRQSLADRGEPIPLPDDLDIARVVRSGDDLISLFMTRVEEAKMHAHRVRDEATLVDKIMELVGEVGAQSALIPAEPIPAKDQIVARLRAKGVQLLDVDNLDAVFSADVGITGVSWAIAETASICLTSGDNRRRLASLAVPCHIAMVRADQMVPDLLDWAAKNTSNVPAHQVFVSGPSKTADIELALVIGVHGPKYQHVVILG